MPGNCATNRPAIVEFGGEWYFFYHNGVLPGGGPHRRSVCVDRLTYDDDGRMNRVHMTTEGRRARRMIVATERAARRCRCGRRGARRGY